MVTPNPSKTMLAGCVLFVQAIVALPASAQDAMPAPATFDSTATLGGSALRSATGFSAFAVDQLASLAAATASPDFVQITSASPDGLAGQRDDRLQVLTQSGVSQMLVEQHDALGHSMQVVQNASVDLPNNTLSAVPNLGLILQSAAYDLTGGSQAATNLAMTIGLVPGTGLTR